MGFLLDTNVISELVKPVPNRAVVTWLADVDEDVLYLSVLTLGEIRQGIATVNPPQRRVAIESWLERDLRGRFEGRLLPIDETIADCWGALSGKRRAAGHALPVVDGLLAATAIRHNLVFVTRNVKDVEATGVEVYNPFSDRSPKDPAHKK